MMSPEQAKTVTYLYDRFMESEKKGWTNLDDYLEILEWLDDQEIYRECDALYSIHKNKKMGCPYEHTNDTICFVVRILEAVEAITDLYRETENLHPRNRYILAHYLALCQDGQIVSLEP